MLPQFCIAASEAMGQKRPLGSIIRLPRRRWRARLAVRLLLDDMAVILMEIADAAGKRTPAFVYQADLILKVMRLHVPSLK
jgi:hypothetical protein